MGNKMKKLICALLASAMLVSSVGIVALADETTADAADTAVTTSADTADDTEATEATDESEATETPEETEAPEATEAPAATEAPTASSTSTSYDNDAYYQKALALCSSLGIISGYEDGSVKPESNVTRAEMASIVLRMLAISSTSTYQNGFTDVASSHWAADQIQTAQDQSIISGMGDGTFVPDGDVTYAQVIVMLVNALNYQDDATYYGTNGGHWASGYVRAASSLDLLKNAPGELDVATERGVVIKMVYNALLADYKDIDGTDSNGNVIYRANETLAEAKFDLIEEKGVLIGTSKTTIGTTDLQDGQIEIRVDKETDATKYDCTLTGLEDYIAQKITYYYRENSGLTPDVLAVTYDSSKTETYTIDDVDDIESITGFDSGAGKIKISGVTKAKECSSDVTIVYNGKVVKSTDVDSIDELLKDVEIGSIKLVNSDKTKKNYDVMFVDSYETMIISSASADRITGLVSDPDAIESTGKIGSTKSVTYKFDDSEDRTITVTRAGADVKLRNLKKDDVASIKRSLDDTVVDIVVTGESITGTASAITKKVDNSKVTVNGTRYDVANIAADDLKTGSESTFYLDMFGRIAYIDSVASGLLQTGEKYGWIMDSYLSENKADYIVKIMTTDGKAVEYTLGTKIDYWAPSATSSTSLSDSEFQTEMNKIKTSSTGYLQTSSGLNIKLVKYKASSSNALSRVYFAVDSSKVSDEDALRVNPKNLRGTSALGGAVSGYSIADGILEMSVPATESDMKSAGNYKIGTVTASKYVVKENGPSIDFIVGEFEDSINPTILITFTASADEAASFTDMDSSGSGPMAMVVDDIDQGVDDDDNTIYTINGYIGGADVSITTNKNTNVGILTSSLWTSTNNGRNYDATSVWDGTGKYDNVNLGTVLKKGDLILYTSDGKLIAKFADAEALGDNVLNGTAYSLPFGSLPNKSTSRCYYYFNKLEDYDLGSSAWIKIKDLDDTIMFDSSKLMDVVTISSSGKVDIDLDGATVSDLIKFDSSDNTGDFIFVSTANKGDIGNIIVFRFE